MGLVGDYQADIEKYIVRFRGTRQTQIEKVNMLLESYITTSPYYEKQVALSGNKEMYSFEKYMESATSNELAIEAGIIEGTSGVQTTLPWYQDSSIGYEMNLGSSNVKVPSFYDILTGPDSHEKSLLLSFVPGISDAKDIQEAITGYDLAADRYLTVHERNVAIIAAIIPLAGGKAITSTSDELTELIYDGFKGMDNLRFTVDPAMHTADEAAGVLKNGVYIKNPTAQNLTDIVTDTGRIGSKKMSGTYMYAVDLDGNVIIGTRAGQRMPHPTLVGGANPKVQAAGIVDIRGGKIYKIDNASGHFKPSADSLNAAKQAFENISKDFFHKDFQGYIPFE